MGRYKATVIKRITIPIVKAAKIRRYILAFSDAMADLWI
jgi:hypothetical protein